MRKVFTTSTGPTCWYWPIHTGDWWGLQGLLLQAGVKAKGTLSQTSDLGSDLSLLFACCGTLDRVFSEFQFSHL